MSNTYFQFRQFAITQDRCAMKVSTDACIHGACTPVNAHVKQVLDIGTGTGLLSLMLAQRASGINIDAIELDTEAAAQANENISASPFRDRINVLQGDIKTYTTARKYDLIICNPPFFTNSLLSDTAGRNIARHTITLNYKDLVMAIKRLLNNDGYGSVLLPSSQQQEWEALLVQNGFSIYSRLLIKPYEYQPANRVVSIFGLEKEICVDKELVIYRAQNSYTDAAIQLLSPFYAKEMK